MSVNIINFIYFYSNIERHAFLQNQDKLFKQLYLVVGF